MPSARVASNERRGPTAPAAAPGPPAPRDSRASAAPVRGPADAGRPRNRCRCRGRRRTPAAPRSGRPARSPMMPTSRLPPTICFSPGAVALHLGARAFDAQDTRPAKAKRAPSSNATSSTPFGAVEADFGREWPSPRLQLARLLGQHDRDAVADRIGEAGLAADQFAAPRGRSSSGPLVSGQTRISSSRGSTGTRGPARSAGTARR